jgi:hypothetical protein
MSEVRVCFEDVDGDGDCEVVVENDWLRTVLRFPDKVGESYYGRRFTWGGRLQSLIYRPTGYEYFMAEMIDPENVAPFGLPDELFEMFPFENGESRQLKMGVGVFDDLTEDAPLTPLPWSWHQEKEGDETAVVFRQEAEDLGGYSFVYEKRYRFRDDSAWFAFDAIWKNGSDKTYESDWDIHSFHQSGEPPNSSWFMAPKRSWISCGKSRVRTVLKEASPIFATLDLNTYVADRIPWDLDGPGWWYALGPGNSDEFYLLRGRFEPFRGLFWHAWRAFTPQGICHVSLPPGESAVWGFDVTLGSGGKNFVAAGEDCGITIDREDDAQVAVRVHGAHRRIGAINLHVMAPDGATLHSNLLEGHLSPGQPLSTRVALPHGHDYVRLAVSYSERERVMVQTEEIVPCKPQRPTAHLPFDGGGRQLLVHSDPNIEEHQVDYLHFCSHAVQCGFKTQWHANGSPIPDSIADLDLICLTGDAWPHDRIEELAEWIRNGGGLLLSVPTGALAKLSPLVPQGDAGLQACEPPLGLMTETAHVTADSLMMGPGERIRIARWMPATAAEGTQVTLSFTDADRHPAVGLQEVGKGRVAGVATRPAWGEGSHAVIWDGWGQYTRAFWGGLMGWVSRCW